MQIKTPIPDRHLPDAARLWWDAFAPFRWGRPPEVRAGHGIAAIAAERCVGVAGLRNATGGFLADLPLSARLLYRPAPDSADLVLDGIAVVRTREGIGTALLKAAAETARRTGYPGVRAEVALGNPVAMAFYANNGFAELGRGNFGWPWTGQVAILRRSV